MRKAREIRVRYKYEDFAIGDLHLSFGEGVEKPMDIFGDLWQDHAARLKAMWQETVSGDDIVILCGDISWGLRLDEAEADFQWIRQLPGKKVIFKETDLWWQSAGKLNRLYGSEDMTFVQNKCYVVEAGGKRLPFAAAEDGYVRERSFSLKRTEKFMKESWAG